MLDERKIRRSGFREGRWVCLSDGRRWALAASDHYESDPECDALLRTIAQAEDKNELLFAELALTIFLLTKNYHLHASDIQSLLQFNTDDPALASLQRDVHAFVLETLGVDEELQQAATREHEEFERSRRTGLLGWFSGRRRGASQPSSTPVA